MGELDARVRVTARASASTRSASRAPTCRSTPTSSATGRSSTKGCTARWAGSRKTPRCAAASTPTDILPGAKSVVCVARRYARPRAEEADDPETARAIARYARGRDYHNGVRKKLRQLAAFLRRLGTDDAPVHARPLVDDAPILERAWAARAGLGFVGKNGLLIVPGQGSLVLLGEVVTTLALTPDSPMPERCGACTRCLDACPTHAFVRPFVLDPRRCVAYLTIEQRGPVPEELREGVGEHLFGCDDCQTVCPFNQTDPHVEPGASRRTPGGRRRRSRICSIRAPRRGRACRRGARCTAPRADGLARNAAIVLANRGEAASVPALEQAAEMHPSAVVRDAAAWAATRIRSRKMLRKEARIIHALCNYPRRPRARVPASGRRRGAGVAARRPEGAGQGAAVRRVRRARARSRVPARRAHEGGARRAPARREPRAHRVALAGPALGDRAHAPRARRVRRGDGAVQGARRAARRRDARPRVRGGGAPLVEARERSARRDRPRAREGQGARRARTTRRSPRGSRSSSR